MEKAARGFSHDPKFVAKQIINIIDVLIGGMSPEAQQRAYPNLREKIKDLNAFDMSQKRKPGGSSIGVSIGLVKNILNSRDPHFIRMVIDQIGREL